MSEAETETGTGSGTEEIGAVLYERPSEGVVRLVLNRPDKANAQNLQMLYGLNEGLDKAAADNSVRVIIIAANGKHFSSGHGPMGGDDDWSLKDVAIGSSLGFAQPGPEGHWAFEEEVFFGLCWRWRNIPKPTIAEVQGKVIAGGLMLVWPFDLVVASEDRPAALRTCLLSLIIQALGSCARAPSRNAQNSSGQDHPTGPDRQAVGRQDVVRRYAIVSGNLPHPLASLHGVLHPAAGRRPAARTTRRTT